MKKKLLILISMLAVMFSLAACDDKVDSPFEYGESQIVFDTMYLFEQYQSVGDEFADYYINDGSDIAKSAVKGIRQAKDTDKVGEFESFQPYMSEYSMMGNMRVDYTIENTTDSVSVTIVNHAQNRDVEVTVKYEENPEYYIKLDQVSQNFNREQILEQIQTYYGDVDQFFEEHADTYSSVDDIVNKGIEKAMEGQVPYVPVEMVVSAVYNKSELMKQAGMNTAIGMGTVFVVLIFISFIISLFKYLPAIFAKKPKLEDLKKEAAAKTPVKAPEVVGTTVAKSDDLMNDAELVAVITAAIYAATGQNGNGAVSKDTLVVRSIRRARR